MVESKESKSSDTLLGELKTKFKSLTEIDKKVKLEKEILVGELDDFYSCLICLDIVWDAKSCEECERVFCGSCLQSWLQKG